MIRRGRSSAGSNRTPAGGWERGAHRGPPRPPSRLAAVHCGIFPVGQDTVALAGTGQPENGVAGSGKRCCRRRHWRTENLQERTLAWLYLLSSFSQKLLYAYQENQGLRTEAQMLTRCFRPASRLVGSLLALATDDKMSPENEYILLKKFQVVDRCWNLVHSCPFKRIPKQHVAGWCYLILLV